MNLAGKLSIVPKSNTRELISFRMFHIKSLKKGKLFRKMLTFVSQLETVLTTLCQGLLRKSHLIVTLFRNKEI